MTLDSYIYEEYLKDVENGNTNLTFEEYLDYSLYNVDGVYTPSNKYE